MSAEDIREEILLLLAKTPDMTAAEIYDACTLADTQQAVYAQINYLKRNGQIVIGDKDHVPYVYRLAKPLKEIVEVEQVKAFEERQTEDVVSPSIEQVPTSATAISTAFQIDFEHDGVSHRINLSLKHGNWYLSARRVIPVTPDLLRQMADLIEENT